MKKILICMTFPDTSMDCKQAQAAWKSCCDVIAALTKIPCKLTFVCTTIHRQYLNVLLDLNMELIFLPEQLNSAADENLYHFDAFWCFDHSSFYTVLSCSSFKFERTIFHVSLSPDDSNLLPLHSHYIQYYCVSSMEVQRQLLDLKIAPHRILLETEPQVIFSRLFEAEYAIEPALQTLGSMKPELEFIYEIQEIARIHQQSNLEHHRTIQQLHSRLQHAEQSLHSIYSSKSWKITEPLRWLFSCVKSFKFKILRCIQGHSRVSPKERLDPYLQWILDSENIPQILPKKQPLISILMVLDQESEPQFKAAIKSVIQQTYPHFEICLVGSNQKILGTYTNIKNTDIKSLCLDKGTPLAECLNQALNLAAGEFSLVLNAADRLSKNALQTLALWLETHPEHACVYSDEDRLDLFGARHTPYFKSDWNLDLARSQNFCRHFCAYQTQLLREIGGFKTDAAGAEHYDIFLRSIEFLNAIDAKVHKVGHIPHVLYHVVDSAEDNKNAEMAAITRHLERCQIKASVLQTAAGYRVKYALPQDIPKVSIIIPTKNGKNLVAQCVNSIFEKTNYPNYEIILVDNGSTDKEALQYFGQLAMRQNFILLKDERVFNYSALNNLAAKAATGEVFCLLNNDTEVIANDWLTEMVSHALRPEVGAVGALLRYPDQSIQHVGMVLGTGEIADVIWHTFRHLKPDDLGYFNKAALIQNYCAVTGACLVIKRSLFFEMKGLDTSLAVGFNDVDFCLRLHLAGYWNVFTPYAELYHYESITRGQDDTPKKAFRYIKESHVIRQRYADLIAQDPFYHPNFDPDRPYKLKQTI